MKKILTIGTLLLVFAVYNCKNQKAQPEEIVVPEQTNSKVSEDIDTTTQISPAKMAVEKEESETVAPTTTNTEATKTKTVPTKVEKATKTITEPITEKKTEVAVDKPVQTKTETKTEAVINPPAETKTEPTVTETPKTVDPNTWKVPSKYVTMKNPIPAKTDAAIGKSLYDKHCKSCHGKEGYGDGTKAADLKGDLGDFSSVKFHKQTDGEIFYKTTFGRDDMPEFAKKLPDDEDRWLIVNYIRTLKQ